MCEHVPTLNLQDFEQFVKRVCDWSDSGVIVGLGEPEGDLARAIVKFKQDQEIEVLVYGGDILGNQEGSAKGDSIRGDEECS